MNKKVEKIVKELESKKEFSLKGIELNLQERCVLAENGIVVKFEKLNPVMAVKK